MTKAFSYLRFSTPEQARGDSQRRQIELARRYALEHELDLDESSYSDLGVSSYRGLNARSGALGQFLEACEHRLVPIGSFLLVENLDRITRQDIIPAAGLMQQIITSGIIIVNLQNRRIYSSEAITASPFLMIEMLVDLIRGNEESRTKSLRLKAAWANKRSNASTKPLSARGPAWLRLENGNWVINKERSSIVRLMFELASQGIGENSIAIKLNKEQVPTFGDNGRAPATMWRRSYITKCLQNPSVVGVLRPNTWEYHGARKLKRSTKPIDSYYPCIVSQDLWESVQAIRLSRSPQRGRNATREVQNIFGGLARCIHCGSAMTRVSKGAAPRSGLAKLVCTAAKSGKGCVYQAVPLELLERSLVAQAKKGFGVTGKRQSTAEKGIAYLHRTD